MTDTPITDWSKALEVHGWIIELIGRLILGDRPWRRVVFVAVPAVAS